MGGGGVCQKFLGWTSGGRCQWQVGDVNDMMHLVAEYVRQNSPFRLCRCISAQHQLQLPARDRAHAVPVSGAYLISTALAMRHITCGHRDGHGTQPIARHTKSIVAVPHAPAQRSDLVADHVHATTWYVEYTNGDGYKVHESHVTRKQRLALPHECTVQG